MRVHIQVGWMLVVTALLAGGCGAQGSPEGSRPSASRGSASAPAQPKVIVVGIMQEPTSWAPFVVNTSAGGTLQPPVLITRTLTVVNNQGVPQAELAIAIPTLDGADWKVNPDGSMDQTWKVRPEALWHDGQPITAEDYVFGWQIFTNP